MKQRSFCLFLLAPILCLGLEVDPDSMALSLLPFANYNKVIDTIKLVNTGNGALTVDSVTIRFLDGDSMDFKRGYDCDWGKYYDYNYKGWVYGMTYLSLRYVKDSLFLLQDSSGVPITVSIPSHDTADFRLAMVVNCVVCGRMPAFPNTTRFLYTFYTAGAVGGRFLLTQNNITKIVLPPAQKGALMQGNAETSRYNSLGRIIREPHASPPALLLKKQGKTMKIHKK
jgi:hypothetical protein